MTRSFRKSTSRRPFPKAARFTKRYARVDDMPVIHRHAAG